MRIAYVCADRGVPVFGCKGSSVHVQEILRAMLRRGADVDLYAARVGGEAPADLRRVRVRTLLDPSCGNATSGRAPHGLEVDRRLRAALVGADSRYDLVYERHALWSSSAMGYASSEVIPGILEVNAPLVDEQLAHRSLDDPELARRVVNKAMRFASLRIAVSNGVAESHRGYGLEPDDFLVVPNGVSPDRFEVAGEGSSARAPDDPFTIGFLGTLKPWHGLDRLVDAFIRLAQMHSQTRLLIVGDGPMRGELETRLEAASLSERVQWAGAVEPEQVPAWLSQMDVGTAPYTAAEDHYFSPLKVLEYMAAGLPVVASRAGQIGDLVEEGRDGWLVEPGCVESLVRRLDWARKYPAEALAMGRCGRRQVLAHRTWDAVWARILAAVYPSVTANREPVATNAARFVAGED